MKLKYSGLTAVAKLALNSCAVIFTATSTAAR